MSFSTLGLSEQMLQAIKYQGFEHPYPIQVQAIPPILNGRDIVALAPTGAGKTAAYILPLLDQLQHKTYVKSRMIPVLILVPTRELALQVEAVVQLFNVFLKRDISSKAVFGGVSINPQMKNLYGTELLIATPGRLLDLASKKALDLSQLKYLVIDEMDKMFNLGFQEEMERILTLLPKKKQCLLFSATTDTTIDQAIASLLHQPVKLEIAPDPVAPELITQTAYLVSQEKKGPLLRHLITSLQWQQVLVFVSSIRAADNLATKLNKNGIAALALHGDKSQGARTEALRKFKSGGLRALVATDLAARGIDIEFLPYVVNYELPRSPKDYVHRIGRTGRAERKGEAISLITEEDKHHFKVIQKKMKRWVDLIDADNLEF
ncbi:MAG TPA: DEAD/DEAH box helicase [Cyclobacteriaceae bacterium]|nr:DEAD/DEAH box helicase [Cyclobacteriaceae bacterium]